MWQFLKSTVILFLIIICATFIPKIDAWRQGTFRKNIDYLKNIKFKTPAIKQLAKSDNSNLSLDLEIEFLGSLLKGSLIYSEQEIKGTLSTNNLSAALFPQKLFSGVFSLNANISGSAINPQLLISIDTSNLQLIDPTLAKFALSADNVSLFINNGQFFFEGKIKASNWANIDYKIKFPIEISLDPWSFQIPKNASLSGNLSAEGEIAPILHKLLDTPTSLSGKTKVDLAISGTYEDPQLNGTSQIIQGSYEISDIGVLLTDITASIQVNGPLLSITEISAVDGKGGHILGKGFYIINERQNYPFSLNLALQETTLLNQDYLKIICNGPLIFKGNNNEGVIVSKLEASSALISIPERSSSTINTVDVIYVNIPEKNPQPQSLLVTQKSSWPLSLDINLKIPKTLNIQGRDLSSVWRGEIDVQGTSKNPLLYGELKIVEGQYLFNGNPFALNQATVTFSGDFDKKTTLYAIASKDLDRVKVDVIAKGPVKNPAISFRSNPPMPQREILSWLLFNRGTSQISPFQGAQLSESITNLSTNQQGPDVLSKIRSMLKIDRFEIGRNQTNENEGVNVEVGKYISDNILISVIKSDVNRIALEATLSDQIKLQAQVGDDSEGKLMLRWKKDY
jgi:translocation and assembly module TamB